MPLSTMYGHYAILVSLAKPTYRNVSCEPFDRGVLKYIKLER